MNESKATGETGRGFDLGVMLLLAAAFLWLVEKLALKAIVAFKLAPLVPLLFLFIGLTDLALLACAIVLLALRKKHSWRVASWAVIVAAIWAAGRAAVALWHLAKILF